MTRPARLGGCVAVALTLCFAACKQPEVTPEAVGPIVVHRLESTADGSVRLREDSFDVTRPDPGAGTTTASTRSGDALVTVDPEQRFQQFDGVGVALTDSSAWLLSRLPAQQRRDALRALFDPEDGAGLSIVRLVVGSSDFARGTYTYDDSPTPDPDLSGFSIDHDREAILPVAREIRQINPDVRFTATPWSPPAWMKDSGQLGYGRLLPQYEGAFADYLVRFVQAYAAEGVEVSSLTLQNEPQLQPVTYPGMAMDADQQARIIADDLGPALTAAGLDTEVLVFDHNWDDPDYPLQVLQSPGVEGVAAGVAFHCYQGDQASAQDRLRQVLGVNGTIWVSECSGGDWQGTRQDAFLDEADLMVQGNEHGANATLLWNLALDPDGGPHTNGCDGCRGVITVDGDTWRPEVDRDVLAHVGRWVEPQSRRVSSEVAGGGDVGATAFRTTHEQVVLVLHNHGARQRVVVDSGRASFPVTLPAGSLTTLRWSA